tara:strand:- start:2397 stop:5234 length:2838 start_codon:yes stop_codon:yes gene_type:complete
MGSDYCSVVVKTREGRPIKIDGNKYSKISAGCTSSQVESSVLTLYDKQRLKFPMLKNKESNWRAIDKYVKEELTNKGSNKIYVVSHSINSPSTLDVIDKFSQKFDVIHVEYDTSSYSGILDANKQSFGIRKLPFYDFSKAKTVVSFGYDFLGSSFNHNLFNQQFTKQRVVYRDKREMSRLYTFESNLSLTGANSDHRIPIKTSHSKIYIAELWNILNSKIGSSRDNINYNNSKKSLINTEILNKVAEDLIENIGSSLVISSSNNKAVQSIVIMINELLRSYGNTIDLNRSYNIRRGDDRQMTKFVNDLEDNSVHGVIFLNSNPVYDHYLSQRIRKGLDSVPLKISTSDRIDETSILCDVIAPDSHFLESWNDYEPIDNNFSFGQPTIRRIFDTRQSQDSFLKWIDYNENYFSLLKNNWRKKQKLLKSSEPFQIFWDRLLHDGVAEIVDKKLKNRNPLPNSNKNRISEVNKISILIDRESNIENFELNLYHNMTVSDGIQSNNPWLQEMPDPISKVCWDNYISVNPKDANKLNIKTDAGTMTTNLISVKNNDVNIEIPAIIQPGQAEGTIGLALGYGRKLAGPVGDSVGVDAVEFLDRNSSVQNLTVTNIKLENTLKDYRIAQTQTHETIMARESVIQETSLDKYKKDPYAGKYQFKVATSEGYKKPEDVTLWSGHEYKNHHWVMAIDLNACTGCGSCVIACQVENNIPVVGKEEVLNRREMAWLRIDRYYSSDADVFDLQGLEKAAENPDVTFQPMMCQHCNNAPCETVCPVAATTHSSEGLNQMTYNRCIGTRYCANNCPYKVRRFNWFKYHDNEQFDKNIAMNNDLGKMVLNPDVTVRSRGVMEKCSFCVQKIQEGKLLAKTEKRRLRDGDVKMACGSACSTDAIVFGDVNDKNSRIRKLLQVEKVDKATLKLKEERAYAVLDEIRVSPNVWYLRKVRNKKIA